MMNRPRFLLHTVILALVAVSLVGCSVAPTPLARLDGKCALFIVPDRFSDVEYRIPRRILEELGVVVTVASWSSEAVMGSAGHEVQPEVQLGDVHGGDYDALVFVGGQGVKPTAPETQRLVQEAVAADRVVAAICAARAILTIAGLRVQEGGRAEKVYVERSGRIVEASGPGESRGFGAAIAAALGELEP
jgi:hypothetical protein